MGATNTGMPAGTKVFDGMKATMAGIVTHKKTLIAKNNKMMAFVDMEDLFGEVEVVVFPNVYEKYMGLLKDDSLILVKGSINFKEGEIPKLLADQILDLRSISANAKMAEGMQEAAGRAQEVQGHASRGGGRQEAAGRNGMVKMRIPDDLKDGWKQVKDLLRSHKGTTPVLLYAGEKGKSRKMPPDLWVEPGGSFEDEAAALLGKENIKVLRDESI